MTRTFTRTTVLLLLAGGCAPPLVTPSSVAPPSVNVELPRASASSEVEPPDPAIVSVTAARAPKSFALDGDLGEWGSLPPPLPSLLPPPSNDEPTDKPTKEKDLPANPPEAASHLAIALTGEAALIAVELGEPARDGIWVGIGSHPPDLPVLGQYFGRMGFVPLGDCETSPMEKDGGYWTEANPPEVVAACKAVNDRHAAFTARHEKRFVKFFRIDREGVRGVLQDGALGAIEGAKSAWKTGPKGATAEISLPLAAMPRVATAPLESLRLVARAATSPTPPGLDRGPWVWVKLPDAVSFEPHAALRAHAFKRALELGVGDFNTYLYTQPRGLSFQPGDAQHVEIMDSPDCSVVVPREETLYQKQASLGDVEVGNLTAPVDNGCNAASDRSLVIFNKGKLVEVIEELGSVRGVVTRNGELHVIAFKSWNAAWVVKAVASDGSHRNVHVQGGDRTEAKRYDRDFDVSDFVNETFDSFGWRGVRAGKGVEMTWSWNSARKIYTVKEGVIPLKQARSPKKTTK